MNENWRLFVAIELPTEVLRAVGQAQASFLKRATGRALRPVRPEGIHLTLKFLGDVPREGVDRISEALFASVQGSRPFDLTVDGLGCFPDVKRPRVVWVGVGGAVQSLKTLRAQVEKHIAPLGYPTENRPFNPHLTLARVQRSARPTEVKQIGAAVTSSTLAEIARWNVHAISLMRSELRPGGAVYTRIAEARLA